VLESKLDTLLQRQQAALDAALTASAALAAIQGLSERQVAALSGLDAAVKEQVRTISVATQQGLISLATVSSVHGCKVKVGAVVTRLGPTRLIGLIGLLATPLTATRRPTHPGAPLQALSYWKVARRNRAAEAKVYRLANTPCSTSSVVDHTFTISNENTELNATARDRSVGLNNRIIGGLLLHTWRAGRKECPATRFSNIQVDCGCGCGLGA